MGTPNFASPSNASKYFVVGTNREEKYSECECGKYYEREEGYREVDEIRCTTCGDEVTGGTENRGIETWEWDDIQENLKSELDNLGYNTKDVVVESDRNYPISGLREIYISKQYGDIEVILSVTALIQSAYYEGATLDWIVKIEGNVDEFDYMTGSRYDSSLDEILDDIFNDHYSEMNAGLRSIMKGYAEAWIEQQITDISEKIEGVYEQFSEHKLTRKGVFSNREAVYETVE